MEKLLYFNVVIWILIDRAKPLWAKLTWASLLTTLVALALGMAIAFTYRLDLFVIAGLAEAETLLGSLFSGFFLAGGSSIIHELISKVKTGGEKA